MALGARQSAVSSLFVRQGLALAGIGVVVGIAAAILMRKALEAVLFGVAPTDPATYAVMSAALVGAALLASYIPARRTAAVYPVETLRAE